MTVEAATYITELDETNPPDSALANELDDHLRLIKSVLKNTMNGTPVTDVFDEAVTATMAQMNTWDARLTALEAFDSPAEITPVFGHEQVSFGPDPVISLGFRPSVILAWATTKPFSGDHDGFQMSFGAWSESAGNAFPLGFAGRLFAPTVGPWDRVTVFLSFLFALSNQTSITESAIVADVTNDGFTIDKGTTTSGAHLLYIAWPNADQ